MKTNEYELMNEPTDEEVQAYKRVRYYYTQLQVAEFLRVTAPEPLDQHEFNAVVHFAYETRKWEPADADYIVALYLNELRGRKKQEV